MRIVFAGTPEFAALHLQALLDDCSGNHDIVAVYTQPDRPAGRGKKLTPSPVKALAESHGIPVHQPLSLKGAEQQQVLAELNADIMVVVAYGLLLPPFWTPPNMAASMSTPHCYRAGVALPPYKGLLKPVIQKRA